MELSEAGQSVVGVASSIDTQRLVRTKGRIFLEWGHVDSFKQDGKPKKMLLQDL